jgi:hypothetical protein
MRWIVVALLGLGLATPANASLVTVEIDADHDRDAPFVVRLSGRYAGIHENRSHHWRNALVKSGRRRPIYVGFENPILNIGVYASIHHPAYLSAAARVDHAPYLLWPASFPTFEPRPWSDVVETGELPRPGSQVSAILASHLSAFVDLYLPTMDEAGRGDEVAVFLPQLEELHRFVRSHDAGRDARDFAARASADAALRRVREWLSVAPVDRMRVRELMEQMRGPKPMGEDLMTDYDFEQLGAFLARHARAQERRRKPRNSTSWTNPENQVEYRVHLRSRPSTCASLSVTADLTQVVEADLGGMTKQVNAQFCQRGNGEWRYGLP